MRQLRRRLGFSLGLLVALVGAVVSHAQSSKISPDLANNPVSSTVDVIIQYYNPPSAGETGLLGLLGGLVRTVLGSINAIVANVTYGNLTNIAADPNVKYISPDRPLAARQQAGAIPGAAYTVEPINAPAVWQRGSRVHTTSG